MRYAALWLLGRRSVCGRQLEILLSHFKYFILLRRSVLSCFSAPCKYVRVNYQRLRRLVGLGATRDPELRGVMPLTMSDWDMDWVPEVVAYDSCPEGREQVCVCVCRLAHSSGR